MTFPIVFLFSGQGSQYFQMGRELYYGHRGFRSRMDEIDGLVMEISGRSVIDIIYDESRQKYDRFDEILISFPAIFMIEYALARTLVDKGIKPDYLLGASQGELVCAVLSGMLPLEELLKTFMQVMSLIKKQTPKGRMISILAHPRQFEQAEQLHKNSFLASVNSDGHFVVSCHGKHQSWIESYLGQNDIPHYALQVVYGFHSPLIDTAALVSQACFDTLSFKDPEIPFISCAYGKTITSKTGYDLWDVIREPIKFQQAFVEFEKQGDFCYLDLGPSDTLTGFSRQNLPSESRSECYPILTPFGHDLSNLDKIYRKGLAKYPAKRISVSY